MSSGSVRLHNDEAAAMPMRSRGAFGPEAIAEMNEILNAAFEKLQDNGKPDVVREIIAMRNYRGGKTW
jgi:Mor family transcriptional regulator